VIALVAQVGSASYDPLGIGVVGVLFVSFVGFWLGGKIISGREYERVLQINDKLSADNDRLRERLIDSADRREENATALRETAAVLRDVLVVLEVKRQAG